VGGAPGGGVGVIAMLGTSRGAWRACRTVAQIFNATRGRRGAAQILRNARRRGIGSDRIGSDRSIGRSVDRSIGARARRG